MDLVTLSLIKGEVASVSAGIQNYSVEGQTLKMETTDGKQLQVEFPTPKSAYDIAVEEGFTGTKAEWLESLKGKSAYEIAVDNGYIGTESEWITSLTTVADGGLSIQRVSELPTTDISNKVIYLVQDVDGTDINSYNEYIRVNNKWELVGSVKTSAGNDTLSADDVTEIFNSTT